MKANTHRFGAALVAVALIASPIAVMPVASASPTNNVMSGALTPNITFGTGDLTLSLDEARAAGNRFPVNFPATADASGYWELFLLGADGNEITSEFGSVQADGSFQDYDASLVNSVLRNVQQGEYSLLLAYESHNGVYNNAEIERKITINMPRPELHVDLSDITLEKGEVLYKDIRVDLDGYDDMTQLTVTLELFDMGDWVEITDQEFSIGVDDEFVTDALESGTYRFVVKQSDISGKFISASFEITVSADENGDEGTPPVATVLSPEDVTVTVGRDATLSFYYENIDFGSTATLYRSIDGTIEEVEQRSLDGDTDNVTFIVNSPATEGDAHYYWIEIPEQSSIGNETLTSSQVAVRYTNEEETPAPTVPTVITAPSTFERAVGTNTAPAIHVETLEGADAPNGTWELFVYDHGASLVDIASGEVINGELDNLENMLEILSVNTIKGEYSYVFSFVAMGAPYSNASTTMTVTHTGIQPTVTINGWEDKTIEYGANFSPVVTFDGDNGYGNAVVALQILENDSWKNYNVDTLYAGQTKVIDAIGLEEGTHQMRFATQSNDYFDEWTSSPITLTVNAYVPPIDGDGDDDNTPPVVVDQSTVKNWGVDTEVALKSVLVKGVVVSHPALLEVRENDGSWTTIKELASGTHTLELARAVDEVKTYRIVINGVTNEYLGVISDTFDAEAVTLDISTINGWNKTTITSSDPVVLSSVNLSANGYVEAFLNGTWSKVLNVQAGKRTINLPTQAVGTTVKYRAVIEAIDFVRTGVVSSEITVINPSPPAPPVIAQATITRWNVGKVVTDKDVSVKNLKVSHPAQVQVFKNGKWVIIQSLTAGTHRNVTLSKAPAGATVKYRVVIPAVNGQNTGVTSGELQVSAPKAKPWAKTPKGNKQSQYGKYFSWKAEVSSGHAVSLQKYNAKTKKWNTVKGYATVKNGQTVKVKGEGAINSQATYRFYSAATSAKEAVNTSFKIKTTKIKGEIIGTPKKNTTYSVKSSKTIKVKLTVKGELQKKNTKGKWVKVKNLKAGSQTLKLKAPSTKGKSAKYRVIVKSTSKVSGVLGKTITVKKK